MPWTTEEFIQKARKVRRLLEEEQVAAIVITSHINFLWLTGGRAYINAAAERACCDLVVTSDKTFLMANNIEVDRLMTEELSGLPIEKLSYEWWGAQGTEPLIKEIAGTGKAVTDAQLGSKFSRLRWELSPQDRQRYLDAGRSAAAALEETAYEIMPGQSEQQIATMIREKAIARGVTANVTLVAVDDRVFRYRHPLPTEKKLDKYAMLVITGLKHGLYSSVSRLVHFGEPPLELKKRHMAVAAVDAAFIRATRPGATIGQAFLAGLQAYRDVGFGEEWKLHHQGGLTGYMGREVRAVEQSSETIQVGQAFAWNPTIAGVKSEDTFLVELEGPVIVTPSLRFPQIQVEYDGGTMSRPGILVR